MSRVFDVKSEIIEFDDGHTLQSSHEQDCCEWHYLYFGEVSLADFEGLEFDLSGESFFERVEGYGIRLIPTNGHPVPVAGYDTNNGYYSTNLSLELWRNGKQLKEWDIEECQTGTSGDRDD